jgi:Mn-dependent DtxR family transcriptional regulator
MELLKAIASAVERDGYQPSLAELAAALRVEVAHIMELLAGLQARGVVSVAGDRAVKIVGLSFTAHKVAK